MELGFMLEFKGSAFQNIVQRDACFFAWCRFDVCRDPTFADSPPQGASTQSGDGRCRAEANERHRFLGARLEGVPFYSLAQGDGVPFDGLPQIRCAN